MTKRPLTPLDLDGLSHLAPELAATIAAIASDIALVVGPDGIIRNVALGQGRVADGPTDWVGRAWVDTVTPDTRKKIEQLLSEASTTGVSRRREVNHPSDSGTTIPMTYTAIRLGTHGPVLVAGRDLRAIAAIQQRFLDSQQEIERSYWQRRQAESRDRMLFQAATDAVFVVDAASMVVVDANPAATDLLKIDRASLIGASPVTAIEPRSQRALDEMLLSARATGNPAEIRVRLASDLSTMSVSALPFRGETGMLLLVRLSVLTSHRRSTDADFRISGALERMSDAVVVTDSGGRLLMANAAFMQMCQLSVQAQITGMSLGDWLGDPEQDLGNLLTEIRHRGIASSMSVTVRTRLGELLSVDISAALLSDGEKDHIGITLRRHPGAAQRHNPLTQELSRKLLELTGRVGELPMAELLEALLQTAERHFAQAALERAQGDRDAAAKLLGIHRELLMRHLGAALFASSDSDAPTPPVLH